MSLNVQSILQAQRPEFVLGELAREIAAGLVAELGDTVLDDGVVVGVVAVHEPDGKMRAYS